MAKQVISLGVNANDHLGDPLRTAFTKVNSNFTEVYNSIESINNQPSPVFNGGNISQPLRITNDTNTSGLSTGALSVKGGASVDRSLYVNDTLFLGSGSIPNELVSPAIVARRSGEQYTQGALINSSSTGSADWVAYGDIGTSAHGWADMGFTGSFFNDPAYTITETGDGYVFASGYPNGISHGSLVLATDSTGIHNDIDFGTGGFFIENVRMSLVDNTQQLEVYMDTESTSVDTGSITTAGGVGIAKDLYVGGTIHSTNIIPNVDVTYDLGSPTKRFKDLYLSGNTIDLGGAKISADLNGNIHVAGVNALRYKPLSIIDGRQEGDEYYNELPVEGEVVVIDQVAYQVAMNSNYASLRTNYYYNAYIPIINEQGFITDIEVIGNEYYPEFGIEPFEIINTDNMWIVPGNVDMQNWEQLATVLGDPLSGAQLLRAGVQSVSEVVSLPIDFNQISNTPTVPTDVSDLTDTEGLLGGGGSSDILTNSTQTFSLNEEGNVIFSGETGGVNRGLVWDYGAEVGGENSTVRQDVAGLSVRAWTEVLDNEELYSAPVNIVTNQDGNAKVWTFDGDGNLALPAGGSITEGIVTDNPTIELAPANPSVESQKLVIKGGGGYYAEANGIWINLSNITFQVGDTVTAYIGSETYAGQTLYWWIVPEESGISDPGFGTVTLDESGLGNFSFEVDNEDEFTVRVSQVENVYDPTTGVESLTINGDIGDHHLHLTTGDLAETSIFLGTDNHNVRTTVDGGIQITTPNVTDNVWQFGADGDITLPASGNVVDSTGVGQLANRVEGSWTVTSGTNTYSFTVPSDGTYTMWVKCNIPNGIIVWNATASVSNSNVPAIGTQYAWNYTGGGSPILLTAIPDQIVGTAGGISTDNTYVGTTSNRFDFTIANTSGETQIVYYGYTKV